MKSLQPIILLFGLLMLYVPLAGQETKEVRDLGLWSGIAVRKTLKKDWTLSLEQEFRFDENISRLNNFFTEAGVRYDINKSFALQANYRYTRDQDKKGGFETRTRYNFDLRYKGSLSYITLAYRLRYQKEVEDTHLLDPEVPYEKYLRHRITVTYRDFEKLKPYISAEVFKLFEMYQPARYHYYRLLLGVEYRANHAGRFKLAWGFNHELNSTLPATLYLFKLKYMYSF